MVIITVKCWYSCLKPDAGTWVVDISGRWRRIAVGWGCLDSSSDSRQQKFTKIFQPHVRLILPWCSQIYFMDTFHILPLNIHQVRPSLFCLLYFFPFFPFRPFLGAPSQKNPRKKRRSWKTESWKSFNKQGFTFVSLRSEKWCVKDLI